MPFIRFGDKQITITPGSAEEIMQQLKDQLDAKIDAAALNAVVSTLRTEQKDGDTDTLIKSSVELIEEDPESGIHNGYVLKQGGIVLGHIHTPQLISNAYISKEGDVTYLVIEFVGQVNPLKIDVTDLIEVEDPWTQEEIDEIFG